MLPEALAALLSHALLLVGAVFFLAGTVGLLRFPDVYTRLHVLAKVGAVDETSARIDLTVKAAETTVLVKAQLRVAL